MFAGAGIGVALGPVEAGWEPSTGDSAVGSGAAAICVGAGVAGETGATRAAGPRALDASSRSANSLSRLCWALASMMPVPQSWKIPNSRIMSPSAMTVLPSVPKTRATVTAEILRVVGAEPVLAGGLRLASGPIGRRCAAM